MIASHTRVCLFYKIFTKWHLKINCWFVSNKQELLPVYGTIRTGVSLISSSHTHVIVD